MQLPLHIPDEPERHVREGRAHGRGLVGTLGAERGDNASFGGMGYVTVGEVAVQRLREGAPLAKRTFRRLLPGLRNRRGDQRVSVLEVAVEATMREARLLHERGNADPGDPGPTKRCACRAQNAVSDFGFVGVGISHDGHQFMAARERQTRLGVFRLLQL